MEVDPTGQVSRSRSNVEWREKMALSFLQISPSYAFVTQASGGRSGDADATKLAQLKRVTETFKALGPLSGISMEAWLRRLQYARTSSREIAKPRILYTASEAKIVGRREIRQISESIADHLNSMSRASGTTPMAFIALPLVGGRKELCDTIIKALDDLHVQSDEGETTRPLEILKNKIREHTVEMALRVVRMRAMHPDESLAAIGQMSGVSPEHEIDLTKEPADRDNESRRLMAILTSRFLNRALLLAENAALGQFPSLDPLPRDTPKMQFDYTRLADHFRE